MAMKITHPLEAKVDQIIKNELGTAYKNGAEISFTKFESIRNTAYVRSRLEKRGFRLLAGSVLRYTYRAGLDEMNAENHVVNKLGKEDVLNRFKHEAGVISNEGLKLSERDKLSRTITYLRQIGYVIESKRDWSKKAGTAVTTYKLKTPDNCELSEAC